MVRKSIAVLAAVVLIVLFSRWAETVRAGGTQAQAQSASASGGASPTFVSANKKYVIRWQPGANEIYTVLEVRGMWARAKRDPASAPKESAPAADVWLNLAQAITITEQR